MKQTEIDCELTKWRLTSLISCQAQDFYNKVILPSITYGILVWGSCNVTLFDRIEKMHARATKIIYRLHWTTEAGEALLKAGWKSLGWHYKHRRLAYLINVTLAVYLREFQAYSLSVS